MKLATSEDVTTMDRVKIQAQVLLPGEVAVADAARPQRDVHQRVHRPGHLVDVACAVPGGEEASVGYDLLA